MTKWFFALSEASMDHPNHDWKAMIHAAVMSAKANTCLQGHFLYDGAPKQVSLACRTDGNVGLSLAFAG